MPSIKNFADFSSWCTAPIGHVAKPSWTTYESYTKYCVKCGFSMDWDAQQLFKACVGEAVPLTCVPCWRSTSHKTMKHFVAIYAANELTYELVKTPPNFDHILMLLKASSPYFRRAEINTTKNMTMDELTFHLTVEFTVPLASDGSVFEDVIASVNHASSVLGNLTVYDLWPHLKYKKF